MRLNFHVSNALPRLQAAHLGVKLAYSAQGARTQTPSWKLHLPHANHASSRKDAAKDADSRRAHPVAKPAQPVSPVPTPPPPVQQSLPLVQNGKVDAVSVSAVPRSQQIVAQRLVLLFLNCRRIVFFVPLTCIVLSFGTALKPTRTSRNVRPKSAGSLTSIPTLAMFCVACSEMLARAHVSVLFCGFWKTVPAPRTAA